MHLTLPGQVKEGFDKGTTFKLTCEGPVGYFSGWQEEEEDRRDSMKS